jgi:hypothetical protein
MNTDEHGLVVKNYAFPFDFWALEVDHEGQGDAGGFEVVEALGIVFRAEAVDAFEFEDDLVFDQDVGEVVADQGAFVGDGEGGFGFGVEASRGEFVEEGAAVDGFEEAGSEDVGDFEDGGEDGFGEGFGHEGHGESSR